MNYIFINEGLPADLQPLTLPKMHINLSIEQKDLKHSL